MTETPALLMRQVSGPIAASASSSNCSWRGNVGNVAGDGLRLDALRGGLSRDRLQVLGQCQIADRDIEAFAGQGQRDGTADAAARAGDEGLAFGEPGTWMSLVK